MFPHSYLNGSFKKLMENVNENVNNVSEKNVNIKSFGNYICRHSSTIAIVLSIISILFSGIALVNTNKRPNRNFHAARPYDIQANAPDGYFNGNNYGSPDDNQFYRQRPQIHSHMQNGNGFDGNRQNNNQNGRQDFKNNARFNKPNNGEFGNRNNSQSNNNSKFNSPSTSDSGPTVAPEISPSK